VVTLTPGSSHIELAVRAEDRERALAPFAGAELDLSVPAPRPAGTVLTSPEN
jgi:hypothetical protein